MQQLRQLELIQAQTQHNTPNTEAAVQQLQQLEIMQAQAQHNTPGTEAAMQQLRQLNMASIPEEGPVVAGDGAAAGGWRTSTPAGS